MTATHPSDPVVPDADVTLERALEDPSSAIDGVTSSRYAIEPWFFATATVPGPYVPILV